MIVELRSKSQITIPIEFIKKLDLSVGDKFEVMEKDGFLMFVPVSIYPKSYIDDLKKEVAILKKRAKTGKQKVFNNIDQLFKNLDEE